MRSRIRVVTRVILILGAHAAALGCAPAEYERRVIRFFDSSAGQ
ncbi:MAG TPA: hypothetical protein VEJ67_11565 [Candidatus Cybelea sp.]|nr:hypothetical protein [Candidatus Cybelea sp.]